MTRSVILVINSTLIWGNNLYDAWPYNATKLNLHVRSPKKTNHLNIVNTVCIYHARMRPKKPSSLLVNV